jgi:acyl-coenzyme A synthetase/AMP-(fatty) acid ligase
MLYGAQVNLDLGSLIRGSCLDGRLAELHGRSVVLAVADQALAALILIELDGVARRIVLCPVDVPPEHLPHVIATAEADAVVSDSAAALPSLATAKLFVARPPGTGATEVERQPRHVTEWILLTSGTTGVPKLVVHSLESLTHPIASNPAHGPLPLWSTFYDIRRYGGLQVFLRAMLGGGSLVLSSAGEAVGTYLERAAAKGATHILGTPTHWRSALMSPSARRIQPRYVRLSGEIADQVILDHLRDCYPNAGVVHAFASTEAGVAFEVADGKSGFPAGLAGARAVDVDIKVEQGSLRLRSPRTASRYLGVNAEALRNADGFVDTGDMVEQRGERCYFVGRRGGVINVGGQKIHPEEVEAVINSHPQVRLSLVRARKSPITGALVIADVVLCDAGAGDSRSLEQEIKEHCRARLPRHKVPATINFVPALEVSASGKLERRNA